MATVAGADLVLDGFDFLNISALFKVFENCLSRFKSCHTRILTAVENLRLVLRDFSRSTQLVSLRLVLSTGHMSVIGKGSYNRKTVAKSYLKVVRVVCRRDFNNARSLGHIGVLVAYNRDFLIEKRQNNMTAVKMSVSRVVAVYCNRGIAEHGLGSCCGKLKLFARLLYGIEKMPEVRVLFLVLNLCVRNRSIAVRTPVYHSVAPVNQILIVQADKHLANGLAAALVKGESLSVPVARRAHFFELFDNSAAVLFFPFPRSFEKFISAQILFGKPLLAHSLDYLCLGCNRRMVRTGKPEGIVTRHSVITDKNILQCIVKGMSHMKLTCDIGGRNDYCIGLFPLLALSVKILVFNPCAVNAFFDILWVILFFKFFRHIVSPL